MSVEQSNVLKYDSSTQASFRSSTLNTLQGNSGGLTVIGGTGSGDDITLSSTSHATKGSIFLGTASSYDQSIDCLAINATPSSISRLAVTDTNTATTSVNAAAGVFNQTANPSGASTAAIRAFDAQTFFNTSNANSLTSLVGGRIFAVNNNSTAGGTVGTLQGVALQCILGPILTVGGTGQATTQVNAATFQAVFSSNTTTTLPELSGGIFTAEDRGTASRTVTTQYAGLFFISKASASSSVSTDLRGIWVRGSNVFGNQLKGGTATNTYMLDIEGFTSAATTYTNTPHQIYLQAGTQAAIAVRQLGASNTNRFQGNTRIGADTAPTVALDVTGAALISSTLGVTGTLTMATPFTLGATSVTTTGTQLNYLNAATGTTGTTSTNVVFSTSPTLTTPVLGVATGTSLAVSGLLTSSSATAGIGYATGAGGTVTQATSKSTGVTLNTVTGTITMNGAALGNNAEVVFTVTNSACAATDIPVVAIKSGATAGAYNVGVTAVAAGSFRIYLGNVSGGSLSEAVVLSFAIIKGVAA